MKKLYKHQDTIVICGTFGFCIMGLISLYSKSDIVFGGALCSAVLAIAAMSGLIRKSDDSKGVVKVDEPDRQ